MAMVSLALAVALMAADGPIEYLTRGEEALSKDQYAAAVESFEAALDTRRLHITGQAMAYWSLHYSYIRLNNLDNAAICLLGFIVYSLDYIDFIDSLDKDERKIHPGAHWLRQFGIRSKLKFAAERISAYWEFKSNEK